MRHLVRKIRAHNVRWTLATKKFGSKQWKLRKNAPVFSTALEAVEHFSYAFRMKERGQAFLNTDIAIAPIHYET